MAIVIIILNLGLRDMLPPEFEFSAIFSDNLRDVIKFYYLVAALFQPYDFKITILVTSPCFILHQYFEMLAWLSI